MIVWYDGENSFTKVQNVGLHCTVQFGFNFSMRVRYIISQIRNIVFGLRFLLTLQIFFGVTFIVGADKASELKYVPAPIDNPLKGLVPYAGQENAASYFPHSMEFSYLALSDLVVSEGLYDWERLEKLLQDIASRGRQAVFRIWMEYPGRAKGIPAYLEKQGVRITEWSDPHTSSSKAKKCRTPDYEDPRTRQMLHDFILELGRKYDGDVRIGFITAGLLGSWGEWHTHPRTELMASKEVQAEVMDAYESAFKSTRVLFRYPAGPKSIQYAANDDRPFGYHDDSFAWSTLETDKSEENWFFIPLLNAAGPQAIHKWKKYPIGGEIRPELWGQIFDSKPKLKRAQDFSLCVSQTHVSWLMDSGMFQSKSLPERLRRAKLQVGRMGYEFYIKTARSELGEAGLKVKLKVENRGVAPFYYDWQVELGLFAKDRRLKVLATDWKVTQLLPKDPPRSWDTLVPRAIIPESATDVAVRIVNPLPRGRPLVFANALSRRLEKGWLRVGTITKR